jgi:hypothetical protein
MIFNKQIIICHRRSMKKVVSRFKNHVQDFKTNLKKKIEEYRKNPKSKRQSFFIGLGIPIAILGISVFGKPLSALASDIPGSPKPKPTDIIPAPAPSPAPIISTGLSGAAATVCGLAITSGSFAVGIACGLIVVIGILHTQGK